MQINLIWGRNQLYGSLVPDRLWNPSTVWWMFCVILSLETVCMTYFVYSYSEKNEHTSLFNASGQRAEESVTVHLQEGWESGVTGLFNTRYMGPRGGECFVFHLNSLCAESELPSPLRASACSPLQWMVCHTGPSGMRVSTVPGFGGRQGGSGVCLCPAPGSAPSALLTPGRFDFSVLSLQRPCRWWISLVRLLCWKKRSMRWDRPSVSGFCLILGTLNIVGNHLGAFHSRCLLCGSKYLSNATFPSFCLTGTGVLSVCWFSLWASFLSNCSVTSDISLLPSLSATLL